jgi:hypothetical protein
MSKKRKKIKADGQLTLFYNGKSILMKPHSNDKLQVEEKNNSYPRSCHIINLHDHQKVQVDKIYQMVKELISHLD